MPRKAVVEKTIHFALLYVLKKKTVQVSLFLPVCSFGSAAWIMKQNRSVFYKSLYFLMKINCCNPWALVIFAKHESPKQKIACRKRLVKHRASQNDITSMILRLWYFVFHFNITSSTFCCLAQILKKKRRQLDSIAITTALCLSHKIMFLIVWVTRIKVKSFLNTGVMSGLHRCMVLVRQAMY